ncbi:MAG TPA: GspH/FimT family pseudopilin [Longimicrobium sp.]|nr:GspH/FimT family pseudopilin [Longimicrobium sp.]
MQPTACTPPRRDRGYTLVELMVTLALLGVLLALAWPRLEGFTRASRLRSATDRVSADLTLARLAAVREGRSASLRIDNAGTRYTVVVNASGTLPVDTVKRVTLSSEYPGVVLTPNTGVVTFDSRGMLTSGEADLRTAKGTQKMRIQITGVGRILRDYNYTGS